MPGFGGYLVSRAFAEADFGDAQAVEGGDFDNVRPDDNVIAKLRPLAERRENEAADRGAFVRFEIISRSY